MKILICAQSFGFGPASKAVTISKALREKYNVSTVFVGRGNALQFASQNERSFDNVIEGDIERISHLFVEEDYDNLLSVMYPEPIVLANNQDIHSVFVDSLFWFWETNTVTHRLNEINPRSDQFSLNNLQEFTPHERELLAHSIADRSFAQTYPSTRDDNFPEKWFKSLEVVGPIVDTTRSGKERPRVIVSLCGQLSPVVSLEQATLYARKILDILREPLEEFQLQGFQPLITGNDEILERINTPYETGFLDHGKYLETLDTAPLLMCPPSITSVYEAVMYETPIFFLPEQHAGHWPNYKELNKGVTGVPFDGIVFGQEFNQLRNLDEQDADRIYSLLSAHCRGQDIEPVVKLELMFERAKDRLKALKSKKTRFDLQDSQMRAIETRLTTKNGAEQIASKISRTLKP